MDIWMKAEMDIQVCKLGHRWYYEIHSYGHKWLLLCTFVWAPDLIYTYVPEWERADVYMFAGHSSALAGRVPHVERYRIWQCWHHQDTSQSDLDTRSGHIKLVSPHKLIRDKWLLFLVKCNLHTITVSERKTNTKICTL